VPASKGRCECGKGRSRLPTKKKRWTFNADRTVIRMAGMVVTLHGLVYVLTQLVEQCRHLAELVVDVVQHVAK